LIGITVGIDSAHTEYNPETGKIHKVEVVKIDSVSPNSVAADYFVAGDIVSSITVDGVDYEIVRNFNLIDVMITARKDSSVVFHITRGGEAMDIEVDLSGIELTAY
jgi:S1-C subfamily serine protease